MKICHFISSIGLGRGEFYVDLANEMAKNKKNIITLLIPKNAKFLDRINSDINIIEYKSKDKRNNPFLYLELYKIFKENNFDIVHTHFAKSTEIFYRLNKILKNNHLATKHNPRKGKIFNKVKYVSAVSEDVKNSIKNKNVKVIYNGVSPCSLNATEKNNFFTIRAIGRLDKIKGFDKLIKEFKNVDSNCHLEIIGDGEEKEQLQSIIDKLDLSKRVNLLGFKNNIPDLISSSDLIVMTSLSEGFSLVMLESLFYGKLFISTPVSGCKDILSDKLLIKNCTISEKINNVYNNYNEYLAEFSNIKSIYKKKFLLSNIVVEYNTYYLEIIKKENYE